MKLKITIFIFFIVNYTYSQINYCSNCEVFENENQKTYSKISKITLKEYKGTPNFKNLSDQQKEQLIEKTIIAEYNESGKIKKYQTNSLTYENSYQFDYNDQGQIETVYKKEGSIESKTDYKYDPENDEVISTLYKSDNLEADRIVKYTLLNGLVTKRVEYFGDGSIYKQDEFQFDSNDNEIYSDNYGVQTFTDYQYSDGKIASKKSTNNYKKGLVTKYKYDENGNLIEKTSYKLNGDLSDKKVFRYKNEKLIEKIENFYSENKISSSETTNFEYNDKGNWIKKMVFRNDILNSIAIRKINYR